MNAVPVYDDRYTKAKIRAYGDKAYSNFQSLNVPKDGEEFEFFTNISIDSLLVYENKYYFQVYLNNCPYKISEKQMRNYLDGNLFKSDED